MIQRDEEALAFTFKGMVHGWSRASVMRKRAGASPGALPFRRPSGLAWLWGTTEEGCSICPYPSKRALLMPYECAAPTFDASTFGLVESSNRAWAQ